jgi:hypothetical protein
MNEAQAGDQPATDLYWDISDHVGSVLAEVLVAEHLFRLNPATKLQPPRHERSDVHVGAHTFDVKIGEVVEMQIDDSYPVPCLGIRSHIHPDDAAEYIAVVPNLIADCRVGLEAGSPGRLSVSGSIDLEATDVYWLPRKVASRAVHPWARTLGRPSTGGYWYLRLTEVEQFRGRIPDSVEARSTSPTTL